MRRRISRRGDLSENKLRQGGGGFMLEGVIRGTALIVDAVGAVFSWAPASAQFRRQRRALAVPTKNDIEIIIKANGGGRISMAGDGKMSPW